MIGRERVSGVGVQVSGKRGFVIVILILIPVMITIKIRISFFPKH